MGEEKVKWLRGEWDVSSGNDRHDEKAPSLRRQHLENPKDRCGHPDRVHHLQTERHAFPGGFFQAGQKDCGFDIQGGMKCTIR